METSADRGTAGPESRRIRFQDDGGNETDMRFEILGNLRVIGGGAVHTLSAPKVALLLSALLAKGNQITPADRLIRELWEDAPPRRAADGLHVYISHVRKFLVAVDGKRGPDAIRTESSGYSLRLEPGELDLHDFQGRMAEGRRGLQQQEPAAAVAALEAALGVWRGPAFGGLHGGPIVKGFASWLEESRLECLELLMSAQLAAGREREAVGPLRALVRDYPLRESFCRLLMLALYRSDRSADALKVYQRSRDRIVAEIGLEPGRGMRRLHQAILTSDSVLNDDEAVAHLV
jgi:DNA-binding SARP family transcriptional activator